MKRLRIGLVFTGGGARAAYQVGVLRAIASLPLDVVAVSAVGSGALNGAVLASASSTEAAADALTTIWKETVLTEQSALRLGPLPVLRLGTYLTLLFASGVTPEIAERLVGTAGTARDVWGHRHPTISQTPDFVSMALGLAADHLSVSTDAELDNYLSSAFRAAAQHPRLPLFVSVYETNGSMMEAAKHGLQLLGLLEASSPYFLEVSDPNMLPKDRLAAVMASATLPFVCNPSTVGSRQFIDGSFGGMKRSPGAVPLQPLRRGQSIYRMDAVMVVHTEGGTSWNATDFGDAVLIELRPSTEPGGDSVGYFWSDMGQLTACMALGETDAHAALARTLQEISGWQYSGYRIGRCWTSSRDL